MSSSLNLSYQFCRQQTRREAKNFFFSFLTLPRKKQDSMCAIYTWMRYLDDLADDAPTPEIADRAVSEFREQTHRFLNEENKEIERSGAKDLLWSAFVDTVRFYQIPIDYFDQIIEGALMDQRKDRYESFEDLYGYCYRVASLVGLVSLKVFGYRNSVTEKAGEYLGIAFQLTNILRDVKEDAARGRIYLPQEDLRRFKVTEEDILSLKWNASVHDLFHFFSQRAEDYYQKAKPVIDWVEEDAQPTLRIMTEIYYGILNRIREIDFHVFKDRARLSTLKKLWIVVKYGFLFKNRTGSNL